MQDYCLCQIYDWIRTAPRIWGMSVKVDQIMQIYSLVLRLWLLQAGKCEFHSHSKVQQGYPQSPFNLRWETKSEKFNPCLYATNSMTQTGNNALCRSDSISVYLDRNGIPPPKFRGSPPRANWHVSSLTWTAAESSLTGLLASMKSIVLLLS